MKKWMGLLFNRTTMCVILILLQLCWAILFIYRLSSHSVLISALFALLQIVVILFIVASEDNPVYKIGWIILIGFIPAFGSLLYLITVNKRPSRVLRERIRVTEEDICTQLREITPTQAPDIDKRTQAISDYIAARGPFGAYKNTAVRYFELGELMFAAMLEDMQKAEQFIFCEYFIIAESKMWDAMKEIMVEKAKKGVDVRVMYDDVGSLSILPVSMKKELEESGVKVITFNPLVPVLALGMNNRDHRKILVIDGNVGYNGGINIADEYINQDSKLGHWKDTGLRLEGEAVRNLTLMFLSVWHACDRGKVDIKKYLPNRTVKAEGYVQPFSDSPLDNEQIAENLYMDILWQARDYVYIFTPYLMIDHEMTVALTLAAKRGVDVRIVVPKIPDKKAVYMLTESYFKPLLEAGVRIYRYTPGFIHAKSYVSDDRLAVVGTINMDYRSLYLHFECGTFLMDVDAIAALKQDCLNTFAISEEVTLNNRKTSPIINLAQAVLRVFSPLF